MKNKKEMMLATLGVEPQVVTFTLDCLLKEGRPVNKVVVVCTDFSGAQQALSVLNEEFKKPIYKNIDYNQIPVIACQALVKDFHSEEDLHGLLRTLYAEVRQARQEGYTVHLCLAGGRKVMGIMSMAVAQLLFGPDDRVWYLITEGWKPGAGRHLHANEGEKVWLVPVPVIRWRDASTLVQAVAQLEDPVEMVSWYEKISRESQLKRKKEFIQHWLTPAEREVVRQACRGFDNAVIAKKLFKREQTVANQLRWVYEKLREFLGYPEGNIDRSVLIAEFAPYFTLLEESEHV